MAAGHGMLSVPHAPDPGQLCSGLKCQACWASASSSTAWDRSTGRLTGRGTALSPVRSRGWQ